MKTIEDARQYARDKHRHASPFRVGIAVVLLGIKCRNPYQEGSRGWNSFEEGIAEGKSRLEKERDRAQHAAEQGDGNV